MFGLSSSSAIVVPLGLLREKEVVTARGWVNATHLGDDLLLLLLLS